MPEVVSIEHDDDLDDDFGDDDGPVGRPVMMYVAIGVVGVLLAGVVFFLFRGGDGGDENGPTVTTAAAATPLDASDPRALAVSAAADAWAQMVNSGGDMTGLDAFFDPNGSAYANRAADVTEDGVPLRDAGPRTNPYSVTTTDFVLVSDDENEPVVEATMNWAGKNGAGVVETTPLRFRWTLRASTESTGWRVWSIGAAEGDATALPKDFCAAAKAASELASNDEATKTIQAEKEGQRFAKFLEITEERLVAFKGLAATAPEAAKAAADTVVLGLETQVEILSSGKSEDDMKKAISTSDEIFAINGAADQLSKTTQSQCEVSVSLN